LTPLDHLARRAVVLAIGATIGCSEATSHEVTLIGNANLAVAGLQDGDDRWQSPASAGDLHRFTMTKDRYTLAYVCREKPDGPTTAYVIHATHGELSTVSAACGSPEVETVSRAIHIKNVPPETFRVDLAVGTPAASRVLSRPNLHFPSLFALQPGANDLIASAVTTDGRGQMVIMRGFLVTGPGEMDVDFGTGSVPIIPRAIEVLAYDTDDERRVTTQLRLKSGLSLRFPSPLPGHASVVDPGALAKGDAQAVKVETVDHPSVGTEVRAVEQDVTPTLRNFDIPPSVLGTLSITPGSAPVHRPQIDLGPERPAWVSYYRLQMARTAIALVVQVFASAGWLQDRAGFGCPELSGLPGFDPAWEDPAPAHWVHLSATGIDRSMESYWNDGLRSGDQVRSTGVALPVTAPPP
jgi:hypothetical protein